MTRKAGFMEVTTSKPNRYVSFIGINGNENSRVLVGMLRRHIDEPERTNLFWERFKEKLDKVGAPDKTGGRCLDELFLIHSYINDIRELFETYDDRDALKLLEQIEEESC
jgi:N(2)-fixation sustaining protein CowN